MGLSNINFWNNTLYFNIATYVLICHDAVTSSCQLAKIMHTFPNLVTNTAWHNYDIFGFVRKMYQLRLLYKENYYFESLFKSPSFPELLQVGLIPPMRFSGNNRSSRLDAFLSPTARFSKVSKWETLATDEETFLDVRCSDIEVSRF